MLRKSLVGVALVALVATGAAACGSGKPTSSPKSSMLTIENNPISPMTQNFNPFAFGTGLGYQSNSIAMFYEPLLQYNTTKADAYYKWLADSYSWSQDGKSITFKLHQNVKWSDGKAFTADDVAYTFTLMQNNQKLNYVGLPITGATVVDPNTVTISFAQAEFQNIYNIAGGVYIVPKHIWTAHESDAATWTNPTPVGTGPYLMDKFTPQGFTLKANPTYWGGKPKVSKLNFPAYVSNDTANQALANGQIDYAGNNVQNIEQTFVAKDPAHNKYFFPATNTVVLIVNTTTAPFNDAAVRKAVSAAIDRTELSTKGETGYEPPATSSSGLLLPNFTDQIPNGQANDLKPNSDPATVTSLMTAAGYAKDSKGFWAKGGQEVTFNVEDPVAYTDYYACAQLIAQELKPLGFNVAVKGVDPDKWGADLAAGTFSSAIHWGSGGPSAYQQFDNWLDFNLSAPIGKPANGDYGRYNNPQVQQALAAFASTSDSAGVQQAVSTLAGIMRDQAPVIPLLYGAGWFEYNTKHFTGWPTADDSYMNPAPQPAQVEYVVLQLDPVS